VVCEGLRWRGKSGSNRQLKIWYLCASPLSARVSRIVGDFYQALSDIESAVRLGMRPTERPANAMPALRCHCRWRDAKIGDARDGACTRARDRDHSWAE
jgi:hypothetical protein